MHNKSDAIIIKHPNDNYELYLIYCKMQKRDTILIVQLQSSINPKI